MKQSVVYIGIDVAKAHLDVAWAGTFRRLPNERSGHAALVRWIKQSATPVQLICEASGGYEQALLESLEKSEVKVTLVQAVRVRQYARAAGILAKTDRIDAKVLSAFGSAMQPQPTPPLSAEQKRLRQYEAQRRHLSRTLVAEENRLTQLSCAELCAADFTWLHFRSLASIRSCRAFTNVCVPKANRTRSHSSHAETPPRSQSLPQTRTNPRLKPTQLLMMTVDGYSLVVQS